MGSATQLRNQRKGKIKAPLYYKGKEHEVYLSHVKVQITASRKDIFCCKKQVFQLENFRVRNLKAINALNYYITLCMAFLAHLSMKPETNALKVSIIKTATQIKGKYVSTITGWQKVSQAYSRMQKKSSGCGSGQSVRPIVSYALSWPSE